MNIPKKLKKNATLKLCLIYAALLFILLLLLFTSCSNRRQNDPQTNNESHNVEQQVILNKNQIDLITSKQSSIERKLTAIAQTVTSIESNGGIQTELNDIKNTISSVISNVTSGSNVNIGNKLEEIRFLLLNVNNTLINLPTNKSSQDLSVVQAEIKHLIDLVRFAIPIPPKTSRYTNADLSDFDHTSYSIELGIVVVIGILTIIIGLLALFSVLAKKFIYEEISDTVTNKILYRIRKNHFILYLKLGLLYFTRFNKANEAKLIANALKRGDIGANIYFDDLQSAIKFGRFSLKELELLEQEKDKDFDKTEDSLINNY